MAIMRNCCCCKVRTACIIFSVLGLLESLSRFVSNITTIVDFVNTTEDQDQATVEEFMKVHEILQVDIKESDVRRALTLLFTMNCIDINKHWARD